MAPMKALAAEMTATFGKRLAPLGIRVKECTGDMQLSTQEILETQVRSKHYFFLKKNIENHAFTHLDIALHK